MPRGVRKERAHPELDEFEPYLRTKKICYKLDISAAMLTTARDRGMPHLPVGREYRYRLSEVIAWFKENGHYLDEGPESEEPPGG